MGSRPHFAAAQRLEDTGAAGDGSALAGGEGAATSRASVTSASAGTATTTMSAWLPTMMPPGVPSRRPRGHGAASRSVARGRARRLSGRPARPAREWQAHREPAERQRLLRVAAAGLRVTGIRPPLAPCGPPLRPERQIRAQLSPWSRPPAAAIGSRAHCAWTRSSRSPEHVASRSASASARRPPSVSSTPQTIVPNPATSRGSHGRRPVAVGRAPDPAPQSARASATSSTTSRARRRRPSAAIRRAPSSSMSRQNGQPVTTVLAPVAAASRARRPLIFSPSSSL